MSAKREVVLCHYRYDPLDRLIDTTPTRDVELQRFYCKSRLATEIQGLLQRSIFQQDDQILAQQQRQGDAIETSLLATDQQRSVLQTLRANQPRPIAYSPYGHRPAESGLLSLLGFNGERPDPITGHYLLGNGYRAFNPVLMRFNSPDNLSPFGRGGLNPYVYCSGDPVNLYDPTGHWPAFMTRLGTTLRRIAGGRPAKATENTHALARPSVAGSVSSIGSFSSMGSMNTKTTSLASYGSKTSIVSNNSDKAMFSSSARAEVVDNNRSATYGPISKTEIHQEIGWAQTRVHKASEDVQKSARAWGVGVSKDDLLTTSLKDKNREIDASIGKLQKSLVELDMWNKQLNSIPAPYYDSPAHKNRIVRSSTS
ncbi:RHS repeat-associated core domain-containing protein [Pseudomonas fluorescens]|uniref:RHS repeat-associated core domain-containing protein n=1 Tax=Pseudomonas fluorescens TaxID=294 RepID=A0A5E7DBY7_PSEFL|nr:RHS repeat-associated core domain-containing protein [Pseudomonas fluorescens]VVO14860.1 hypothetical protein PS723_03722 [Pseudomonas fluorescens]